MATRYTDIATNQNNPKLRNRNDALKQTGIVLFATALYTMLGTEAATDVINIMKLPPRAQVVPHLSRITGNGIATTATLKIGDDDVLGVGAAADDDRYGAAIDVAASGSDLFTAATAGVADQTPYTTGGETWLQATFATLVTPVAAKKLLFRVAYLVVA